MSWLSRLAALVASFTVLTTSAGTASTAAISPTRPGPLLVGRGGMLYIADQARHQILALDTTGHFRVVAGTGKAGPGGDRGQAVDAELSQPEGMALARDGTLVFADQGNNRVRAISTKGVISTIAGDGQFGWTRTGTSAVRARLGSPAAVTFDAQGRLYIAAVGSNEIVRLERDGTLTKIAGNWNRAGLVGIGRSAVDASPSGPNALAWAGGNLFIAGFNSKALLMIDRNGVMRHPGRDNGFYPRGSDGIVAGPNGRVIAMNGDAVVQLTPTGERPILRVGDRIPGIHSFQPNGIAMGREGSIYLSTWFGNGAADRSAIVRIRPSGSIQVLWRD